MLTIVNPPATETNPNVIVCISKPGEPYNSETRQEPGEFARVKIRNGEDWNLIRLMRHGIDYFAPASGDGILVKAHLLRP